MTEPVKIIANQIHGLCDQTRAADEDTARAALAALQADGWGLIKLADMAVVRRHFAFGQYE